MHRKLAERLYYAGLWDVLRMVLLGRAARW